MTEKWSGVALVQRRGSTVAEWVSGLADHDTGRECTRSTRFQICSLSKQFAAAAVLLLADRGLVTLEDSVERWFPGCPEPWRAITLHHLLTHTSGLAHWSDFPGLDLTRPVPPAEQLERFEQTPLLSAPGVRWRYSSPGYVLLGWIVQQASDQPYADFLADHLFGPLGLHFTSAGDPPGGSGLARGYRSGVPVRSFDLGTASLATGDVWSTADDLIRWDDALAAGEILSARRRREMLAAQAQIATGQEEDATWTASGYGYGWFVGEAAGHRAYFHPGDNPGYLAFNAWLPDDEIRLAVLVNEGTTDIGRLAGELVNLGLDS